MPPLIEATAAAMKRINWHVLLIGIGSLFVAGGPLAYVLTSFNVSPEMQVSILKRGGALVALALAIGAAVRMAMTQTDKGKASTLAALSDEAKERVIGSMPVESQIAVARALAKTLTIPPPGAAQKEPS
jgi:hypothetical protein